MITMQTISWVAWTDQGPVAFNNDDALVRWAQSLGLTSFVAWRASAERRQMTELMLARDGVRWYVLEDGARRDDLTLLADPSDDPAVLAIADFMASRHMGYGEFDCVRYSPTMWPPPSTPLRDRLVGFTTEVNDEDGIVTAHFCPERLHQLLGDGDQYDRDCVLYLLVAEALEMGGIEGPMNERAVEAERRALASFDDRTKALYQRLLDNAASTPPLEG